MVTKQPGSFTGDEWFQWTREAWKLLWWGQYYIFQGSLSSPVSSPARKAPLIPRLLTLINPRSSVRSLAPNTQQLTPASERFSPASPWVIPLLFSLVCLPVSMTASFPVGGAEHSLGQEPTNALKNQKSVLGRKKAAAALTLEKADLKGLADAPALLHCSPPTPHWAPRAAGQETKFCPAFTWGKRTL